MQWMAIRLSLFNCALSASQRLLHADRWLTARYQNIECQRAKLQNNMDESPDWKAAKKPHVSALITILRSEEGQKYCSCSQFAISSVYKWGKLKVVLQFLLISIIVLLKSPY